jgi:hypothetical protein
MGRSGIGLVLGAVAIGLAMAALHVEGTVGVGLGVGAVFALLVAWAVWPLREVGRN